jgi:hypothetical protein
MDETSKIRMAWKQLKSSQSIQSKFCINDNKETYKTTQKISDGGD